MNFKEDIEDMKKEIEEVQEKSWASEFIHDYKKQNKRLFIIILVILSLWFATGVYLVYVLNDIGTETTTETITETIDIDDVDNIQNSNINN